MWSVGWLIFSYTLTGLYLYSNRSFTLRLQSARDNWWKQVSKYLGAVIKVVSAGYRCKILSKQTLCRERHYSQHLLAIFWHYHQSLLLVSLHKIKSNRLQFDMPLAQKSMVWGWTDMVHMDVNYIYIFFCVQEMSEKL